MNSKKIYAVLAALFLALAGCSSGDSTVAGASDSSNGSVSGKAGSMARFALVQDFLYTLNDPELQLYWLQEPASPSLYNTMNVQWGVETLFPYKDKLYIGAETGMYIYDITSPSSPKYVSEFSHVRSCDPVVVQDTIAYVTLRSGTTCWSSDNELEILNVSDPEMPRLIASYPLTNPHGLAVDDSTLFVCDGSAGIKCFNVADPESIKLIQHMGDIDAYDVILTDSTLIAVSADGLYQYDRTEFPLKQLSKIAIGVE